MNRRDFMLRGSVLAGAIAAGRVSCVSDSKHSEMAPTNGSGPLFKISLAEWSLHRALRSGERDHLNFAVEARHDFDIGAVECVSSFFGDHAKDAAYLAEMKYRADNEDVRVLLIMVDGEGNLGSSDPQSRRTAVENHYKWVQASKFLGGHSVRVNAMINEEALPSEEQMRLSADGLRQLVEFAAGLDMNVLVENHGSLSSNGQWLAALIEMVDHPRCGTLPDFGNFCLDGSPYPADRCNEMYDPYRGVSELMPFAKAVSAKSYDFDAEGNESVLDYERLMRIVLDAGYRGHVGIEYEGDRLSEDAGVRAAHDLLVRLREQLAPEYQKH